jgi:hypothetical protein
VESPPERGEANLVLTVSARPGFLDVAQTCTEELARRLGFDERSIDGLSQAVAATFDLLCGQPGAERIRLWFDADPVAIAVEAATVLSDLPHSFSPVPSTAMRRYTSAMADLVDVLAVDSGNGAVRFVRAARGTDGLA